MSFIETHRLLMRTWILPGDLEAASGLFTDADAQRFYLRRTIADKEISSYVERIAADEEREGFGVWPAIEKQSRKLVGACGLSRVADLAGEVEVEWIFAPDARNKGYASEAAQAVLTFALGQPNIERVIALVDPENAPSIAIVNRLGMRYERIVRAYKRDLMQYAATGAAKRASPQ